MDVKLDVLTQEQIQKAINRECLTHSPKTVRNMHGLLTAAIAAYRPDFAIKNFEQTFMQHEMQHKTKKHCKYSAFRIGATGFEPATSRPPAVRATKLRHAP